MPESKKEPTIYSVEQGTRDLWELYYRVRHTPVRKMDDVRVYADGHTTKELFDFLDTGEKAWETKVTGHHRFLLKRQPAKADN